MVDKYLKVSMKTKIIRSGILTKFVNDTTNNEIIITITQSMTRRLTYILCSFSISDRLQHRKTQSATNHLTCAWMPAATRCIVSHSTIPSRTSINIKPVCWTVHSLARTLLGNFTRHSSRIVSHFPDSKMLCIRIRTESHRTHTLNEVPIKYPRRPEIIHLTRRLYSHPMEMPT